jgi:hypothetical protein
VGVLSPQPKIQDFRKGGQKQNLTTCLREVGEIPERLLRLGLGVTVYLVIASKTRNLGLESFFWISIFGFTILK